MAATSAPDFPTQASRVAFLGTPAAAVPALEALCDSELEVVAAITNPDRPRGRGRQSQPSPVKQAALRRGVPVAHHPAELLDYKPELGVVVAYGQLIKPDLLAQLPFCNVHFSLLPRWRGAAPVERALLAGDVSTGVAIMALEETLDTGPVFSQAETPIGEHETAADLTARLAELGAELLLETIRAGFPNAAPQQGEPTWAAKLTRSDLELDWSRPSIELTRVIRVGKAWTTLTGRRLLVHRGVALSNIGAQLAPGELGQLEADTSAVLVGAGANTALELLEVQPDGKKSMAAADWFRGLRADGSVKLGT